MADITDKDVPNSEKIFFCINPASTYDLMKRGQVPFLTPEQVAETQAIYLKRAAKQYLRDTDWYAIRKAETGKDIPTDIKTKRAQARLDASEE